jgi:hypothetical protein
MRWVRFEHYGIPRLGVLAGDTITTTSLDWAEILAGERPASGPQVGLGEVRLLAPVERPGKVIAIGLN